MPQPPHPLVYWSSEDLSGVEMWSDLGVGGLPLYCVVSQFRDSRMNEELYEYARYKKLPIKLFLLLGRFVLCRKQSEATFTLIILDFGQSSQYKLLCCDFLWQGRLL